MTVSIASGVSATLPDTTGLVLSTPGSDRAEINIGTSQTIGDVLQWDGARLSLGAGGSGATVTDCIVYSIALGG